MHLARRSELWGWIEILAGRGDLSAKRLSRLHLLAGLIASHEGRYRTSIDLLMVVLNSSSQLTEEEEGHARLCVAENRAVIGDFMGAKREVDAVARKMTKPDEAMALRLHFTRGFVATLSSELEIAGSEFRAVLESPIINLWVEAKGKALGSLAEVLRLMGDLNLSDRLLGQALEAGAQSGSNEVMEFLHGQKALTAVLRKEYLPALRAAEHCLRATGAGDVDPESLARAALATAIAAREIDLPGIRQLQMLAEEVLSVIFAGMDNAVVVRREAEAAKVELIASGASALETPLQTQTLALSLAQAMAGVLLSAEPG